MLREKKERKEEITNGCVRNEDGFASRMKIKKGKRNKRFLDERNSLILLLLLQDDWPREDEIVNVIINVLIPSRISFDTFQQILQQVTRCPPIKRALEDAF